MFFCLVIASFRFCSVHRFLDDRNFFIFLYCKELMHCVFLSLLQELMMTFHQHIEIDSKVGCELLEMEDLQLVVVLHSQVCIVTWKLKSTILNKKHILQSCEPLKPSQMPLLGYYLCPFHVH